MSIFVLVHGAWHGVWCWKYLHPLMEASGEKVISFDLPGRGEDMTGPPKITLASYKDRVSHAIARQPEPVILVGHSMGGVVLSETAEEMPDNIACLVYLAAFLLHDGVCVLRAFSDRASGSEDPAFMRPPPRARDLFFSDCTAEDQKWATTRLVPEPTAPLKTPVRISANRFGRVRRAYIECLNDRALPISRQREMRHGLPCQRVESLETGHSPFLSAPRELASLLISIAAD